MADYRERLAIIQRNHDFLVCIDSDGCAFDTMEIKHKECFCPATIDAWDLQSVSKYAREVYEYINLYSRSRGINRFIAIIEALDLLAERPEVKARGYRKPDISTLRRWIESETLLGTPALEAYCAAHPEDMVMQRAKGWNQQVNDAVRKIVHSVPPFPYVHESLQEMSKIADIVVVSATNSAALDKEWNEHGLDQYTSAICGQEVGNKSECIAMAVETGGYEKQRVLMIGDALGDYKSALNNDVLFYPINPGEEEDSWKNFYEQALKRFASERYQGDYAQQLFEKFEKHLPVTPPWQGRQEH